MRAFWDKLTANRPFTWLGHGLVSLFGSLLLAWLLPLSVEVASIVWLVFYGLREVGDLKKAMKSAALVPHPLSYLAHKMEDMQGDLVGPLLVTLTLWVT